MTLSFSQYINSHPTYFVEKILKGLKPNFQNFKENDAYSSRKAC